MEPFQIAQDWLDHLASEAKFFKQNKKPSLFTVEALLDALGRPDKSYEYRVIVGGTAGKGTVCKRIESVLVNEGKKVVTLASPHIQDVRERISINGEMVTKDLFARSLLRVKAASEKISVVPTYYEALVVAGALAGKTSGCEIMIAEVGLGGRWDGVNAFGGKRISVVTFIGEDHMDILGPTLADVAQEKAGVFTKDTVFALSYEQKYRSIFNKKSPVRIEYTKGIKQKLNKKIAQKVCKFLLEKDFVMTPIKLPARWESFIIPACSEPNENNELFCSLSGEKKIVLDGAHSKPRFEFVIPKLKKLSQKPTIIFAMAKNHDPKSLEVILPYIENIIWTTVPGEREFWDPKELQTMFGTGECVDEPLGALKVALSSETKNPIVVIGSFYLCGKVREACQDHLGALL